MLKKLYNRVGAICSIFTKYMYLKLIIAVRYPDKTYNNQMKILLLLKREIHKVNRRG